MFAAVSGVCALAAFAIEVATIGAQGLTGYDAAAGALLLLALDRFRERQAQIDDSLAEMAAEETDQPVRGRDISADGMFGAAALAGQVIVPARGNGGGGVKRGV